MKAKRKLSQNWLVDRNLARKLVEGLRAPPASRVLEIGPGTGALTSLLLQSGFSVLAVEKDERCVGELRASFGSERGFQLLEGDFLDMELEELDLPPDSFVISNLPYSLTSPILFKLMDSTQGFERLVLTVQKEYADRLCAPPACKSYGRLSVMVSFYGRVSRLFDLSPNAFIPRPKVKSTAVCIEAFREERLSRSDWHGLSRLVKHAFSTRRKMLFNCLKRELSLSSADLARVFEELGLSRKSRAEELLPRDFYSLSKYLQRYLS